MALLTQPHEGSDDVVILDMPDDENQNLVDQVISEIGIENSDDCLCKIYRINEQGKEAHCFDTGIGSLGGIEDRLRDAYGKGDYKIKVFTPTPQGKKSIKKVIKLTLETPIEPAAPVVQDNDDFKSFMLQMANMMQQNQQAMAEAIKEQAHQFRESQLESQNKTMEMVIQVMGNKPEAPDLGQQLLLFKQLQPDTPDPMQMLETVFSLNQRVQDMAPQPQTPLGELTHGIDSLVKLAANSPKGAGGQAAATKAPGPAVPMQPGQPMVQQNLPLQQPQQPPQPQQPESSVIEMKLSNPFVQAELRKQLQLLITKAEQGKSAEIFAYFVMEELPEKFIPIIKELIGEGGQAALQRCAEINPGVMQHAEWFLEFADCIKEMIVDDEEFANQSESDDSLKLSHQRSDNNQESLDSNSADVITSNNLAAENTD